MRRGHIIVVAVLAVLTALPEKADARRRFGGVLDAATLPLRMMMGTTGVRGARAARHHRIRAMAARHRGTAAPVGRDDPAASRVGPLFWPYAYDDLISYALWPSDGGDRFLAHGYGDIADAMLVSSPVYARDDAGGRRGRTRKAVDDEQRAPTSLADVCVSRQASGDADASKEKIADATIARIDDMVRPNDAQRSALNTLRGALIGAIEEVQATCPASEASYDPPERLDAVGRRVWAVLQAATALRAPVDNFYNTLNDEQKARLNGESSVATRACFEQAQAAAARPAEQIEKSLQPTREQRPAVEAWQTTSSNMARMLLASCPREATLTPAARLSAAQDRLNAMLYAVRVVSPAFNTLYDSLSNEQKERFKALGQASRAVQAVTMTGGAGR